MEMLLLTDEEKAWAKKHNIDIDSIDNEKYKKIKEGMKKEQENSADNKTKANDLEVGKGNTTPENQPEENKQETALALVVSEMGEEQNKEKQKENQPESEKLVPQTENTAIALYSIDKALNFFEKYAEEKGYTFTRDADSDAVTGSFVDSDNNEQGRVSVKNDNASSDIKGIDALVRYAKESGYESITLGECSEEYAEEMKRLCELHGIKLIGKDKENSEQNEKPAEKQNVDEDTPKALPLPAGDENANKEEITVEEGRGEEVTAYKIPTKIAEVKLQRYLIEAKEAPERLKEEITNSEKTYEKGWYAQTGEDKAFAEMLLQKYAKALVNNEDKEQIEKALQLYGVDTISIEPANNPEGKVKVTAKDFSERTPEEQAEIKAAHEKLISGKVKDKEEKVLQNQPLTKDSGGR